MASAKIAHRPQTALATAELVEAARGYATAGTAESTGRAYRTAWQAFDAWCGTRGLEALPAAPETLALYLAELAKGGKRPATIEKELAGIAQAHKAAGYDSPRSTAPVRAVMKGIRRKLGVAPKQKAPVLAGELRSMVEALPEGLKGTRDRALLLVGFAGAFRRAELAALEVEALDFGADGLTVTLRRSKTDQEGQGRKVGIPYGSAPATCPVRALKAWLEAAGIESGAVFLGMTRHGRTTGKRLSGRDVARTVKAAADAVGLDPARFAGHSLRAGLATSAAKAGKSERAIMAQTGHRSVAMVRRYIRDADLFGDNAAAGLL